MNTVDAQVRTDGGAVYLYQSPGCRSRMPVTCRTCDARTGLVLAVRGEDAFITCPQGHITRDWRLTPLAVRAVVAAAADAGVDVVPGDAEIWLRTPVSDEVLPGCEDII